MLWGWTDQRRAAASRKQYKQSAACSAFDSPCVAGSQELRSQWFRYECKGGA
jgi:hypothetical protein